MLATPEIETPIKYIPKTTGDDLPTVIVGSVDASDIARSVYWRGKGSLITHCAVAMAIRRMYPYLPVQKICIGTTSAALGGRFYKTDLEGIEGIIAWGVACINGKEPKPFNFRLESSVW